MKNLNRNYQLYILIGIMLLGVMILVGTSYALIQKSIVGNNTISMQTGDFLVEFINTDTITLSNNMPMYDNDALLNQNEFTFSITNTGNYKANYSIKIEDTSNDTLKEVIRYSVDRGNGYNNTVYKYIDNQYLVQNKSIEVNNTDTYKVKFWVDIDATEIYINKEFIGKISVIATQAEYKYGTNVIESVYELEDREGLEAINQDGTLYTEGDIREYRYSGSNPKNYVRFNNELWRIIGSFENTYENSGVSYRMLKIVKDTPLETQYPFNSNEGNKGDYKGSSLETYLNSTYYNSINTKYKDMIMNANWNSNLTINTNTAITSYDRELRNNHYNYIGLINASDYGYASTNDLWNTSLNTTSFTSSNNWLHQENNLVLNTESLIGTNVYYITANGLTSGTTTTNYNIKPTLYLKPDVSIISGFGTSTDPYELSIEFPMNYGEKAELKDRNRSLYSVVEETLPSYLLADDGDARILSGGGGHNNGSPTSDANFKNYVWYSGKLWRIVALNNDGSIKLVTQDNITTIQWGAEPATFYSDDGEGNITKSWMYEWLNEDFLDTLYNKENIVKLDSEWDVTTTTDTTKPTSPTKITASVGLLTAYEYTQSYSKTGSYYTGYLNNGYYWWLLTPYNSSSVQTVDYFGSLGNLSPGSSSYGSRPSINLKSNIKIRGGDGSLENPYTIEGDISAPTNNVTKLSERISGEYVNFNGETYRIVSIENDITKIMQVDYLKSGTTNVTKYLSTSIRYGGGTSSDYWDYYLNNDWYNSISTSPINYKGMIVEGNWYLGMYPENTSYKATICTEATITQPIKNCTKLTGTDDYGALVYNGYVGLGRVGEMFTSQIGEGYNDVTNVWTITPYSSTSVRVVNNLGINGYLYYRSPGSNDYGSRPSINLSSNIVITSGLGTIDSPFEINVG